MMTWVAQFKVAPDRLQHRALKIKTHPVNNLCVMGESIKSTADGSNIKESGGQSLEFKDFMKFCAEK